MIRAVCTVNPGSLIYLWLIKHLLKIDFSLLKSSCNDSQDFPPHVRRSSSCQWGRASPLTWMGKFGIWASFTLDIGHWMDQLVFSPEPVASCRMQRFLYYGNITVHAASFRAVCCSNIQSAYCSHIFQLRSHWWQISCCISAFYMVPGG